MDPREDTLREGQKMGAEDMIQSQGCVSKITRKRSLPQLQEKTHQALFPNLHTL